MSLNKLKIKPDGLRRMLTEKEMPRVDGELFDPEMALFSN